MNIVTHVHKIGTNRGKRRIWLDGPRVNAAGFTPGTRFACRARIGDGTLGGNIIMKILDEGVTPADGWHVRKVSGRAGGKPIIDLIGRIVEDTFPGAERVTVTFGGGMICVWPAE